MRKLQILSQQLFGGANYKFPFGSSYHTTRLVVVTIKTLLGYTFIVLFDSFGVRCSIFQLVVAPTKIPLVYRFFIAFCGANVQFSRQFKCAQATFTTRWW